MKSFCATLTVCSALISSTVGNSAAGSVDSVKRLLRAHQHAFAFERERDFRAFRQGAADVEQLASRHGDLAVALHVDFGRRDEFDLEVRRRDREPTALRRQQHVRQDRHRLLALDHADDGLERSQDGFTLRDDLHLY